jgi:adenylate cyclase
VPDREPEQLAPVSEPSADALDTLLLGGPRRHTRQELAVLAGVPLEQARRYWRALGFADTGGARAFTDADVAALRRIDGLVRDSVVGQEMAVALVRALGSTTARLASWQVDLVLEQLSGGTGRREGLSASEAYATAQRLLPELEPLLVHAWRLQLAASVDRVLNDDDTLVNAVYQSVGFADLVGFTRLSRRLSVRDLAALVERFEQAGADVVAAAGARLVKTLGDEVLFGLARPGRGLRRRPGRPAAARRRRDRPGDRADGRRVRYHREPGQPADLDGPARRCAGGRGNRTGPGRRRPVPHRRRGPAPGPRPGRRPAVRPAAGPG